MPFPLRLRTTGTTALLQPRAFIMFSASLRLIEEWLAGHAPRILHESLNPAATEADLDALEAALGRPLPADYRALYRWHDGLNDEADNWGSLWYGMSLLPLAEVLDAHRYQASQTQTSPLLHAPATVRAGALQNPYWLRLGFDGAHSWLLVDLDPTPAGGPSAIPSRNAGNGVSSGRLRGRASSHVRAGPCAGQLHP
jgi:cell wall assembly regulator SMI1